MATEMQSRSLIALDRMCHAWQSRFTSGISPAAVALAFSDWSLHLINAPGKQMELMVRGEQKVRRLAAHFALCMQGKGDPPCIDPQAQDRRFRDPEWAQPPYAFVSQAFLLYQQWWQSATNEVRGVTVHHEQVVSFIVRQLLDIFSPSNSLFTNPVVLRRTLETGGRNLYQGLQHMLEDWERDLMDRGPVGLEDYVVGGNIAVTPGKVVFRNHLIELIQYEPSTASVHAEPVLIVPAWIMKYYILDLSPHNSLVKFLVDHGHTVFIVSWRNPTEEDRDLGIRDYLDMGPLSAMEYIRSLIPEHQIQGIGYCLGGTLMGIAAAALARDGKDWLRSLTLLTGQVDFSEAGELKLFVDPAQVAFLEDLMWEQGYLANDQMAGAFQLLRSNDLIWSRMVQEYLLGERAPLSDLMAWNADTTRMPFRMHSEYLRHLLLDNELALGRYTVNGRLVSLPSIRIPTFAVGAERDHVAPWRSVYKADLLTDADVTFLLASGGHNAGIVSPPGGYKGYYRTRTSLHGEHYLAPDEWLEVAKRETGSWWPAWESWLAEKASGQVPPRQPRHPEGLPSAPGHYVLMP
ncbi:MAG: alpha/beta fold hydrolase [Aquisalimonadaceae bacterium]